MVPEPTEDNKAIKWKQGEESYAIYMPLLRLIELSNLLPHVLAFHDKVCTTFFDEDHQGHAMFAQFPCVLLPVIRTTWDTAIDYHGDDLPPINKRTVKQFNDMLCHFITAHCKVEEEQELITSICALRKPCKMPVQAFWYRVQELNLYINWLPGNANHLPDDEILEIIYAAMPEVWRDCFISSGQSKTIPIAEMVHYFCAQEQSASQHAMEHQVEQKKISSAQLHDPTKTPNSPSKDNKKPFAKCKIEDDNKCPIHGKHKWKDCFANAYGMDPKGTAHLALKQRQKPLLPRPWLRKLTLLSITPSKILCLSWLSL
jgi:hypothetical protein